ncbi:hypothetical protein [Halopelagius fulvigenes]|uniref:DUF2382 domain-containing protein n=1 Tax=Halopelagius fulvigenes TaxID=1198324 RepID=A0ABD5U1E4_9EURY
MLVTIYQYKHEEVQFDDNRTTGESQTEDSVNPEAEEYFGEELDIDAEVWETVEYEGSPIQRREVTLDDVTAVSMPEEAESRGGELPGTTVQIRREGTIEQLEHATVIEAEDRAP